VLDASSASPQQGAAKVLASELLTKATTQGGTQQTSTTQSADAQSALSAYAQGTFLSASGASGTPATLAVIVTPQTVPADGSTNVVAQDLGPFAQALAKVYSTPTVVVGSAQASGANSPIAVLRGSDVANQVSTVDDADTARGQVVALQALYIELNGGSAASYGINAGSSYPSVSPSASASPSTSASPSSSKKSKK
jgi:hypothetical protein